jgi:phosphate transport system permease protein
MTFKEWMKSGLPWIWLNAGCVAISLVLVIGLLGLIAVRGLGYFWPGSIAVIQMADAQTSTVLAGEIANEEEVSTQQLKSSGVIVSDDVHFHTRYLIKVGNRDLTGKDFVWVLKEHIKEKTYPDNIATVERWEYGNFYGDVVAVKQENNIISTPENLWGELQTRIERSQKLHDETYRLEKNELAKINVEKEKLKIEQKQLETNSAASAVQIESVTTALAELDAHYHAAEKRLTELHTQAARDSVTLKTITGQTIDVPLSKVVRVYRPNQMSILQKSGFYIMKVWEFLTEDPREANTEGGIFPAIFGTILMVILMSIIVTPVGVIAAVYLREYAKQGAVTRMIRIAVNNLAGVPSIVYGVFGLGFFVYFLGAHIDQAFFSEKLPSPTFGTPGLLWASITLSLLTLPVVIVATEEGLARIPRSIREGSLALGATQAETIWRVVLPMASPAIMTGLILAVARAAGEVAPLMLVGVVKLAPALPFDGSYPFLHLDRKFMHLGFHIFDVGFQSPNVEAARPLVYATALLLVLVIVLLNVSAIAVRNNLREKYKSLEM